MKKDKIIFEQGFKHREFKFGWLKDILYRLPTTVHGRDYSMREVPIINITSNIQGYRIIRDKKSIIQAKAMTKKVHWVVKSIHCEECLK